ncbi:hypothetical protein, partial [Ralstonia pseudosolanacearum]|uniref:hypothetical protein n=1 Tax=Ralstonia pseudosolanacearum TaxID=1310165 RepID=UPI003D1857B9
MASPVEPDGRRMRAHSAVSFDLIVIGAGSAGLAAARRAAQLFQRQSGGILGMFNLFSGGALSR